SHRTWLRWRVGRGMRADYRAAEVEEISHPWSMTYENWAMTNDIFRNHMSLVIAQFSYVILGKSDLHQRVGLLRILPFHQLHTAVVYRRPFHRLTFRRALVRVPVENGVHVKMVNRLGEP